MSDPTIDAELRDELGSIATFLERVAETPELEPGAILELAGDDPDLELSERIGAGGVGVVYLARDRKLDREVAVKVQRISGDDEADERLLAEARALARLAHPNVVSAFDVRRVSGHLLLIMELVRGPTLRQWLRDRDRDRDEILAAYAQAGAGLAAAHRAGLIHRDFKPDNAIAGDDGRVRVVDFGLAGPAGEPIRGGTPAYMAPEQAAGDDVDARADQYAFAASLVEALAGRALDRDEVAGAAADLRPRWLREALERGLAAAPGDRFGDMSALLAALRPPRRWPLLAAAATALVIAAAAILGPRACAEPVGLIVETEVSDNRSVVEGYQRAARYLDSGHRLQAAEALAAIAGEIDTPRFRRELGEVMRGLDGFERAIDFDRAVDHLALRGDGRRLAITSNAVTTLLDLDGDRALATVDGEGARFVDGDRYLLTSSRTGAITLTRSDDGVLHRTIEVGDVSELAAGGDVILASVSGGVRALTTAGETLFEKPSDGAPIAGLSVSAAGDRMLVARPFVTVYDRGGEIIRRASLPRIDVAGTIAPDGQSTALVSRAGIDVYSVTDGVVLQRLRPSAGGLLRYSPDGARLLVSRGGQACVWSLASGKTTACHSAGGPAAHALSADLRRAASSTDTGVVELWDDTGRVRASLAAYRDRAAQVAISDDGARVVTAGPGGVKLWRGDVDNAERVLPHPPKTAAIVRGGRLAIATPERLALYDPDRPDAPPVELAAASAGNSSIAVSADGSVAAWAGATWNLETGERAAAIEPWLRRQMIALSAGGDLLVTCGENTCRGFATDTGSLRWSLELAGPLEMTRFPPSGITATPLFAPGGELVLLGMGVDLVLDPARGDVRATIRRPSRSFAISSAFLDGARIAIADGQQIHIAGLDGSGLTSLPGRGQGLIAHPDGQRLLVPVDRGVMLVDPRSDERRRLDASASSQGGAGFSPDGSLVAIATGHGGVEVIDTGTGQVIARRFSGDFTQSVHLTAGDRIVAVGSGRTLIWKLADERRDPAAVKQAIARVLGEAPATPAGDN